ncbi:uncharacterized protein LOC129813488 [Salvelinus fontinalis]|uniref:uncharacterized protein LOC129813488 n=1 Tax=Salvelinus fontinalis TaxID=8038 RepID=UPI0024860AA4|nr:uncharacterized protein LOC129813488 [Salvelinus fontinalis]
MQLLYSVLFLTIIMGVSCEDLTPLKKEEYCLEGTPVILSYNYSRKATAGDEFYWYRQDTAQRPELLLYMSGSEFIKKADPLNTRISAKLNKEKTRVDLEISSVEVTDSALFYCAQLVLILHILQSTMLFCSLLLFFDLIGVRSEQVLTPYTDVEVASERDRVKLSCNYSSGDTLQWYRQYPKSAPQLLVMEYADITPGFSLNHDKKDKRVDLEISSAEVTDSALYYCALRPTVTGNSETLYKNL